MRDEGQPQARAQRHHHFEHVRAHCRLESFEEVAEFGRDQEAWFRQFLELPNGIPSHDTLERVLSMLDAEEFERRFSSWAQSVAQLFPNEVVAIDGKTVRRSFDTSRAKKAIHIVSAWACDNELAIGQVQTDEKSNEITAIPKILESLHLAGCIVTIDAMGCQTNIARQITEDKAAHYILGLKGNQGLLHDDVQRTFEKALASPADAHCLRFAETVEKGHGRVETRKCWVSTDLRLVHESRLWAHLNSLVLVEATRETAEGRSVERRYYISSLEASAEAMLHAVRNHWGIENKLHYRLDVSMGEDASRRRRGNLALVSAVMRKIALNLFRLPGRNKASVPRVQARCLYSHAFRAQVLFAGKTLKSRAPMNA